VDEEACLVLLCRLRLRRRRGDKWRRRSRDSGVEGE